MAGDGLLTPRQPVLVLVATSWPCAVALSARLAHLRRRLYRDAAHRARSWPSWGRWGLGSLWGMLAGHGVRKSSLQLLPCPVGKGPSALGATSQGAARREDGRQLCPGLRCGGRGPREDRQREGWATRAGRSPRSHGGQGDASLPQNHFKIKRKVTRWDGDLLCVLARLPEGLCPK